MRPTDTVHRYSGHTNNNAPIHQLQETSIAAVGNDDRILDDEFSADAQKLMRKRIPIKTIHALQSSINKLAIFVSQKNCNRLLNLRYLRYVTDTIRMAQ